MSKKHGLDVRPFGRTIGDGQQRVLLARQPIVRTGHGRHGAAERIQETSTNAGAQVAHRYGEASRHSLAISIARERQVRLGHADRQAREALRFCRWMSRVCVCVCAQLWRATASVLARYSAESCARPPPSTRRHQRHRSPWQWSRFSP